MDTRASATVLVLAPVIISTSAIFLKKTGSRMHSNPKFGRRRGGVTYINNREKGNFQNSVLAHSFTNILLISTHFLTL
jgi:hypothetical protein